MEEEMKRSERIFYNVGAAFAFIVAFAVLVPFGMCAGFLVRTGDTESLVRVIAALIPKLN